MLFDKETNHQHS